MDRSIDFFVVRLKQSQFMILIIDHPIVYGRMIESRRQYEKRHTLWNEFPEIMWYFFTVSIFHESIMGRQCNCVLLIFSSYAQKIFTWSKRFWLLSRTLVIVNIFFFMQISHIKMGLWWLILLKRSILWLHFIIGYYESRFLSLNWSQHYKINRCDRFWNILVEILAKI